MRIKGDIGWVKDKFLRMELNNICNFFGSYENRNWGIV